MLFKNCSSLTQYLVGHTEKLSHIYYQLIENDLFLSPISNKFLCTTISDLKIGCDNIDNVYIYPCVQMGAQKVMRDKNVLKTLFSLIEGIKEKKSDVFLCTSYFNVSSWMKKFMLSHDQKWKILTSSPESNSFFGSKGLLAFIPELYRYNLYNLVEKSQKCKLSDISAFEYKAKNMTFHAKGNI